MLALTNEPLRAHTWFETGGPATAWLEPATDEELADALYNACQERQAVCVLGDGANVLVSDDGFDGCVIHPANTCIGVTGTRGDSRVLVTAGAGALIDDLIEWSLQQGLTGLEQFSGIPGTVGGAVYINVHYFEALLADVMHSARITSADGNESNEVMADWFEFGYDTSRLHEGTHYVAAATFALEQADERTAAFARGRRHEIVGTVSAATRRRGPAAVSSATSCLTRSTSKSTAQRSCTWRTISTR